MAGIYRLPDERRVIQEASEWLARLAADDVTSEDRVRFEAWRSAHPLHRRTFEQLTGTWNRFAAVRALVSAVAFGQSINETAAQSSRDRIRMRSGRYRIAWAAAFAALTICFGVFVFLNRSSGRTYVTTIGEHATISLPDGSLLELDSNSIARVDFSTRNRIVHLERGEAFFKVTHNPNWPFWVVGSGSWVRDVGTQFNVQLNVTGMQVTVSQGTVKVGRIAPLLREIPFRDTVLLHDVALSVLTAGHQADFSGSAVKFRQLNPAELSNAISWRAQTLYFENAPLYEVANQLGRYTHLHIVISGNRLRRLSVAGTLEASPNGVDTFLSMLGHGLGLEVHRTADEVVITSASGTPH